MFLFPLFLQHPGYIVSVKGGGAAYCTVRLTFMSHKYTVRLFT